MRLTTVIPTYPSLDNTPIERSFRDSSKDGKEMVVPMNAPPTFRQTFGWGSPFIIFALFSAAMWNHWLIITTLNPTKSANVVMGTEDFDDGNFWILQEPPSAILMGSMLGLTVIESFYIVIMYKIIFWRSLVKRKKGKIPTLRKYTMKKAWGVLPKAKLADYLKDFWKDVTGYNGRYRRYWNAWLKLVDLAFQAVNLWQYLESGIPVKLIYIFTFIVAMNGMTFAIMILTSHRRTAIHEIAMDGIYDLFVNAGFPLLLLGYSYSSFEFDREGFKTILAMYSPIAFEAQAKISGDQAEIEHFISYFDSIRILTWTDFILRMGMNLSFAYRFKRIIEVMIISTRAKYHKAGMKKLVTGSQTSNHISRYWAILYILIGVAVTTTAIVAVNNSTTLCRPYPQCPVFSYTMLEKNSCPCVAIVDVNKIPKTYQEWINPPNAFQTVRDLAKAGRLQVMQIINRQLPELPEELIACTNLRRVSIIQSDLKFMPEWAKKFKKLAYLHISARIGDGLRSMPESLFEDMSQLEFLHLGGHIYLQALPSFGGLVKLRDLTLALLPVTELPSFDSLQRLQRLQLSIMLNLQSLPDLSPLDSISTMYVDEFTKLCSNGYLVNFSATNATRIMSDPRLNAVSREKLLQMKDTLCLKFATSLTVKKNTKASVDACGGVMYRKCYPNQIGYNITTAEDNEPIGMCYNSRFEVISCEVGNTIQAVRKMQIDKNAGPPCNPDEEAWLGCTP